MLFQTDVCPSRVCHTLKSTLATFSSLKAFAAGILQYQRFNLPSLNQSISASLPDTYQNGSPFKELNIESPAALSIRYVSSFSVCLTSLRMGSISLKRSLSSSCIQRYRQESFLLLLKGTANFPGFYVEIGSAICDSCFAHVCDASFLQTHLLYRDPFSACI